MFVTSCLLNIYLVMEALRTKPDVEKHSANRTVTARQSLEQKRRLLTALGKLGNPELEQRLAGLEARLEKVLPLSERFEHQSS